MLMQREYKTSDAKRAAKRRWYQADQQKRIELAERLASVPDLTRGDERFAAEVTLAIDEGQMVPKCAHARAYRAWLIMAGREA